MTFNRFGVGNYSMLDLLDYRQRVFMMYVLIRATGTDVPQSFSMFRSTRDELFAVHPQSPLSALQKTGFKGLKYYDYDPAYRVVAPIKPAPEPTEYVLDGGEDGAVNIRQIGQVDVELPHGAGSLGVFWIVCYGGGIFIPFRDATNNQTTFGGGRYLIDTLKGADLGSEGTELVLDFNYAYHPSCYYNARWVCPLAPVQNQLPFPVQAGERSLS
jgi:uncharacterized protein